MPGDLTTIQIHEADITQLTFEDSDVTQLIIDNADTTIIMTVPATINGASLSYSNDLPLDISRTSSAGVSSAVSRADHIHSAANLLLDGGNY